jgi:glutathione S-transferase
MADLQQEIYSIYLKEKATSDKLEIVPTEITQEGMSAPEGKPSATVPILDIGNGQHIFQSSAIFEYLENEFPHAHNMRGTTLEAAACVRELMNLMNEACSFLGTYMHNASKLMEGLEPQSEEAACVLFDKCHKTLSILEGVGRPYRPNACGQHKQPNHGGLCCNGYFSVL